MKYRLRFKSRGARTRITKGKSSESNPSVTRHREAARATHIVQKIQTDKSYDAKFSDEDAVLEQIPLHKMQIGDAEEIKTVRSNFSELTSAKSQLSQFTSCTNPTFDPVHRIWRSGSVLQNEVLAVLAATAELIKDTNGTESDTEYFAALLTIIEAIPAADESKLAAAAYLLGLVAKKVDKSVSQKCFSRAHEILENKLDKTQLDVALAKLIATLGMILHQQAASIWQSSNTRLLLVKIEMFAIHNKSLVRSVARRTLRTILSDPVMITSSGCHRGAGVVGELLMKQMEQSAASVDIDVLFRLLCLAENIMHKMPHLIFKKFAETTFALLFISDSDLRCTIFQCFRKILQLQPADTTLPASTNILLIDLLRDFASNAMDPSITCPWMEALCESHLCLATKDHAKSMATLRASLKPIFQTFDLGKDFVALITYKVISRIMEHCVQSNEELASYSIDLCDEALNPRSVAVWRYVLRTETKIFEVCKGAITQESFARALKTLAGLRNDVNRSIIPDIDLVVGAAVRHIGAENVLRVLPLELDPQNVPVVTQFERSWLMPVLRVNIFNQPIAFALQYFLPLAHRLRREVPSDVMRQKTFITISDQLWDLLPNLLSSATDFEQNFPHLAQILGKVLLEQRDLRLIVLSSLRSALRYALQPDAAEAKKDVMRFFAYSFLRKLCTLYTVSNITMESMEGITGNSLKTLRCSVLETVRMYVELTPNNVIDNFINLAVEKAQSKDMDLDQKVRVLDIMAALVKKASVSGLSSMFSSIQPWFICSEIALQKKAFRILEEIIKRMNDEAVKDFFASSADEINNVLDQGLDSIAKSARAALVAVYYVKLSSLTSFKNVESFGKKFLRRIIICLDKSHNIRTRSNALKCFVKLCQQLILFGSDESKSPSSVLHPILNIIFGMLNPEGLYPNEDSVEIVRSSTIALNIIAQKFTRILDASLLSRLVAHACSWISDGRPLVRVLIIRLLRMLAKKLPDYTMRQYQELLLSAVFDGQSTTNLTQKIRKANRLLLEVLIDRYGIEVLMIRTNKLDWIKQLKAVAKIRRRRERRNRTGAHNVGIDGCQDQDIVSVVSSARTAGADTVLNMLCDADSENEVEIDRESIGGRTRGSSMWLKNDDDDENMMDLLDRNKILKKIATSRSGFLKDKTLREMNDSGNDKSNNSFKVAKDGRIIIENLDIDQDKRKRKQRTKLLDMPEKMRRDSGSKSDSDSDCDSNSRTINDKSRWKPGGKGIHRNVCKSFTGTTSSNEFLKRRAAGDKRKKNEKYEPYVYIPINKRRRGKDEMKMLLKGTKKGVAVASKVKKMVC
uniref:Ribosomal RNA-processing protein 12-like conserved domain-containing protein n=1 Tax=Wuchereria bancrofti TaxID=6293 RepID=A0AAF5PXG5_WUCBA